MQATKAAVGAFRRSYLNSDPMGDGASRAEWDSWNSADARRARYRLYWAMHQNTAYEEAANRHAPGYKSSYDMYDKVRALYNPAHRLVEFWTSRLMGGRLDPAAGDGDAEPSCLPIITPHDDLREALARLWRDSSWQIYKEVYGRWGCGLGDTALRTVDDTGKRRVSVEVVHPGHLEWVDFDAYGNVRGYDLERPEANPKKAADGSTIKEPVRYREIVRRDGENVVFETLLNDEPYAWNGVAAKWEVPYGFVPLVVAHHEPMGGSQWGANCFGAGLSRFRDVDDLGSMLTDNTRRKTRSPMLLAGVKDPAGPLTTRQARDAAIEDERRQKSSRDQLDFLYADERAMATSLAPQIDVADVCGEIRLKLEDIEKTYPELAADVGSMSGTITAEAIAMARDRATDKVQTRRPAYEGPMIRAFQQAIAIGGFRKYPGYERYDLGSYEAGGLDMSVGHRPVFGVDPMDEIKLKAATWAVVDQQVAVGIPLDMALENMGWKPADIARVMAAQAKAGPAAEPGDPNQGV